MTLNAENLSKSDEPSISRDGCMRIDLHCHTARFSGCSSLTPEGLVTAARDAGLDAVCLTEHDRLWPVGEARRLSERFGLIVLRGMEVTTELGHVLVYGLTEPPPGMFLAATLVEAVRSAGGLAILAHPARAGQLSVAPAQRTGLFDTVEILNGSDGPEQNRAAEGLAAGHRLAGIAGSDCHGPAEAGTVATVLPRWVTSERELVAVLRLGRHRVERMR
jgi:predicted metal-dependent phosphoesterase TrpH